MSLVNKNTFTGTGGTSLNGFSGEAGGAWTELQGSSGSAVLTGGGFVRCGNANVTTIQRAGGTCPTDTIEGAVRILFNDFNTPYPYVQLTLDEASNGSQTTAYHLFYHPVSLDWNLERASNFGSGGTNTPIGSGFSETINAGEDRLVFFKRRTSGGDTIVDVYSDGALINSFTDSSPIAANRRAGLAFYNAGTAGAGYYVDGFALYGGTTAIASNKVSILKSATTSVTFTGTETAWLALAPVLQVSGVAGCSIGNFAYSADGTMTADITTSTTAGTLTVTDPSTMKTTTIAVVGPMVASVIEEGTVTSSSADVDSTSAASGGYGTISYQLQRRVTGVGSYADVTGLTGVNPAADTTVVAGVTYQYQQVASDQDGRTVTSAAIEIEVPDTAATGIDLTGPTTGTTGVAVTYTVALSPSGGTSAGVTVTLDDGASGTITPATRTLSTGTQSATFDVTEGTAGTYTISVTNDGGLTDPASITLTVSDPPVTGVSVMKGEAINTAVTGTPVFVLFNRAFQFWNGTAFEDFDTGNLPAYEITATQLIGPFYTGTYPAISDGFYGWLLLDKQSTTLATGDFDRTHVLDADDVSIVSGEEVGTGTATVDTATIQAGLTAQGYTTARAAHLDENVSAAKTLTAGERAQLRQFVYDKNGNQITYLDSTTATTDTDSDGNVISVVVD